MTIAIPIFHGENEVETCEKRRVLLDADILCYQLGASMMPHPFLEGVLLPLSASTVCDLVDDMINYIREACGTQDVLCMITGENNFRIEVAKQVPYKGKRDHSVTRPEHYDTVKAHILNSYPHVLAEGREADDVMGELQLKDWKEKEDKIAALSTIIASRDKDLRTIPGLHYSWSCGIKQPEKPLYYIPLDRAMHMFFYQMLIGDSTDNIIGCGIQKEVKWGFVKEDGVPVLDEAGNKIPAYVLRRVGVGSKHAIAILEGCKTVRDMKEAVTESYKEVFGDGYEDVMLENARLLYIGQQPDNLFEWSWLDYALDSINSAYKEPST